MTDKGEVAADAASEAGSDLFEALLKRGELEGFIDRLIDFSFSKKIPVAFLMDEVRFRRRDLDAWGDILPESIEVGYYTARSKSLYHIAVTYDAQSFSVRSACGRWDMLVDALLGTGDRRMCKVCQRVQEKAR